MATSKTARKVPSSVAKSNVTARTKTPARTPAQKVTPHLKSAPVNSAPLKADKKKDKPEKIKVLRDSFTIPKSEYAQIGELKKRALALGQEVKKSELIRAGLLLLSGQNDAGLTKALAAVPTLKTGRPGKA